MIFSEDAVYRYGAVLAFKPGLDVFLFVQKQNVRSDKYVLMVASRITHSFRARAVTGITGKEGEFRIVRRGTKNVRVVENRITDKDQVRVKSFLVPIGNVDLEDSRYGVILKPQLLFEEQIQRVYNLMFGLEDLGQWSGSYKLRLTKVSWTDKPQLSDKVLHIRANPGDQKFELKTNHYFDYHDDRNPKKTIRVVQVDMLREFMLSNPRNAEEIGQRIRGESPLIGTDGQNPPTYY